MSGRGGPAESTGSGQIDPYAVFRPLWGRRVAHVASVLVIVTFTFSAVAVPGQEGQKGDWSIADRLMIFLTGLAIALFLHRFATIRATPSTTGLHVRNIFRQRTLTWGEIVRLQFGGGAPWAIVDLDDTDQVAIMAIQKVDGAHAQAMASRLAALIQVHGEATEPAE